MDDREKVIRGLECCTADLDEYHKDHFCDMCPYKAPDPQITFCFNKSDLMRDALSLLKAQEPRVMTLHDWEANHVAKMPVWVEWSESAKGECADYEKADGWAVLNAYGFADVLCFGGRCWTSRPTDEQRKAAKWTC